MKLSKYNLYRLLAAFKHAQRISRTAYHITFLAAGPKEFECPGTLMTIERTGRGSDDKDHFLVTVNIKEMETRSAKQLRRDAGHEIIHAMLWDMDEGDGPPSTQTIENAVYKLQRAMYGEDDE